MWAWLLLGAGGFVGLAWLAVVLVLSPDRALRLVRSELARHLRRDVRFESVAISLWPPVRIAVQHLELAEPGGFDRGSAFSAAALDLDVDALALFSRRVRVRRLVLDAPAVHLLVQPDGSTNFDSLQTPPATRSRVPPALDLDVRELVVNGGHVLVDDLARARRTTFAAGTHLDFAAGPGGRIATSGETVVLDLALGPLSAARASDLDQGLAKLEIRLRHRGKYDAGTHRLALETLAIDLGRAELALSGVVDSVGSRPLCDLRAQGAHIDLEQVLGWLSVADAARVRGISGHGQLAFDLALHGSLAPGRQPAITGRLTLRDGAFRYRGAPEVGNLSFTADFRPDTVVVSDLRARFAQQPVTARLVATSLADPVVEFALRGNLELAAVGPLVAPEGTRLGGQAVVDLSGRGRARDPGALALSGSAQLRNVSVESAQLPRRIENVNGRIDFLPGSAAIQRLTARAGQSSWSFDGTARRPLALLAKPGTVPPAEVEFTFRSTYLDLAELLPVTPGQPFLPNAAGTGHVAIDRLKHGRLDVSAVQAEVQLSPGSLAAPHFALQGYGGSASGDATFDLSDTRRPAYRVHAKIEKVQADAILSAWTPARNLLAGTLDTRIDFSGVGQTPRDIRNTLTLVGLTSVTDGRLGPGPALDALAQVVRVPKLRQVDFARLDLPMRIEQGRLVTDPVVMSGPSGDWHLAGAIGFDGNLDYAVSVTLPAAVTDALGARSALAAGALADSEGRLLLDLHVSGPARAPRVSWDTQAMLARLSGRASQALAAQRAKLEADAREAARQALLNRFGVAGDSSAPRLPVTGAAARDSVRAAARALLRSFFGRKPPRTPPAPATPPAADTTAH